MKPHIAVCLLAMSGAASVLAADYPRADAAFREQYTWEYVPACIKGIEDKPDLRAYYSHKTTEVYCTCRQGRKADVLAQAKKEGRSGDAARDEAYDYAELKCQYILHKHLEHE